MWGRRRVYTYHRYYYHPYRPYVYGASWHPVGFFLGAIAATATIVAINNAEYRYDAGVFYEPGNGGYRVVAPPAGAIVPSLPPDVATIPVGDETFYYFGGVFYAAAEGGGYQIVPAPAGAIVFNLPEGATTEQAGDITYLQYNGAYYQPVRVDGQDAYEVVDMEEVDQ
jgi:uncharacterized protein DUF6515